MISIAQDYISEELGALPLKNNKAPLLNSGHNYLYELINYDDIDKLFKDAEKIGIACGYVSNGFECMDFDAHKSEPIETIFKNFMNDDGVRTIVETHNLPVLKTPSGGYHIYYKSENIEGGTTLASWSTGDVMIETRGHGQYVATYPSKGYTIISGVEIIRTPIISEEERDYLHSIASGLSLRKITHSENNGSGNWPTKFDTTKLWGKFNEYGVDEAKDLLIDIGWEFVRTRKHDNTQLWRRPGKDEKDGISATFGMLHNMFYNYSSSAEHFKERTAYSPFDILIILKFKGDKLAAIRYLDEKYKEKETITPEIIETVGYFPIDIFPEKLSDILLEAQRTMNHPVDLTGSTLINIYGGLIGNKVKLRMMPGWDAPCIFWTAIVGASGAAKSHPVSFIMKAIDDIDKDYYSEYKNELIRYEYEFEQWENAPKNSKPVKPIKPALEQIIIRDVTMEALQKTHDYNKNGLIMYRDELKGWLGSMNSYRKGSDEETWLEIFNNNVATIGRVTKDPIRIENSFVNVIGTIQDAVLNEIIRKENGLVERFLFTKTYSEIKKLSREKMSQEKITMLKTNIRAFHNEIKKLEDTTIEIPDDVFDLIIQADAKIVDLQLSGKETKKFIGYLSKMRTYLPRFALVIAFIDATYNNLDFEILPHHIDKSSRLLDYYTKSARKLFTDLNETNELKNVTSNLNGKTNKEMAKILNLKGYNNKKIADELGISNQRVGQLLK